MASINRGIEYLLHNRTQFLDSIIKNLGFLFPDKLYLSLRYRFQMGKWIDWNKPRLFTEKLQWLKVYAHHSEYTQMVDKLAAKEYVKNIIGEEYIIPTLAVWDNAKEISIDSLPNEFVLKTTHGGGGTGVVICKDKTNFDLEKAVSKLSRSMRMVVGKEFREHPYYNVPRKIIAEQYMSQEETKGESDSSLIDYKFYCFSGKPEYCQVIRNRKTFETIDFYDMNWQIMPFVGLNPKCTNDKNPLPRPNCLDEMIEICSLLCKDLPFVRIDLYNINQHPYFGEITFYPGGGFGRFKPAEWDEKLGGLIKLPR